MGRPIRVQRSKQFVKVQSEDSSQSDDKSTELNSNLEQAAINESWIDFTQSNKDFIVCYSVRFLNSVMTKGL